MYSIKELSSILKVTTQSLYNLIKVNKDLESIVKQNTEERGRRKFYGEPVLTWLKGYYGIENECPIEETAEEGNKATSAQEIPQPNPNQDELKATISAQEKTIEQLRGQVAELLNDKQYFREENARLLLLLQEEKREKMLLLPEARAKQSIKARIIELFSKKGVKE